MAPSSATGRAVNAVPSDSECAPTVAGSGRDAEAEEEVEEGVCEEEEEEEEGVYAAELLAILAGKPSVVDVIYMLQDGKENLAQAQARLDANDLEGAQDWRDHAASEFEKARPQLEAGGYLDEKEVLQDVIDFDRDLSQARGQIHLVQGVAAVNLARELLAEGDVDAAEMASRRAEAEFGLARGLEDKTSTIDALDLEIQGARRLWQVIRAGDAALEAAREKLSLPFEEEGALTVAKEERATAAFAFEGIWNEGAIAQGE